MLERAYRRVGMTVSEHIRACVCLSVRARA